MQIEARHIVVVLKSHENILCDKVSCCSLNWGTLQLLPSGSLVMLLWKWVTNLLAAIATWFMIFTLKSLFFFYQLHSMSKALCTVLSPTQTPGARPRGCSNHFHRQAVRLPVAPPPAVFRASVKVSVVGLSHIMLVCTTALYLTILTCIVSCYCGADSDFATTNVGTVQRDRMRHYRERGCHAATGPHQNQTHGAPTRS